MSNVQLSDVHGYLDPHSKLFWRGGEAVFRRSAV